MNLNSIAHVPPIFVTPDQTVIDAVEASIPGKVGAVAVLRDGQLVGIFTERDVMLKVVHKGLEPKSTLIESVMTYPVFCVPSDMQCRDVLKIMLEKHIRHLPISDDGGKTVSGMLSIRNVLQHLVEVLSDDLHSIEAYVGVSAQGA